MSKPEMNGVISISKKGGQMPITCVEQFRLGTSVNVGVIENDVVVYGRFVDADEWGEDPEAVAAKIADYLANRPSTPPMTDAINTTPVVMSDPQIAAKLAELAGE